MSIRPLNNGIGDPAKSLRVMNNGMLSVVKTVKVMNNGALSTCYSNTTPMSASVSPSAANGSSYTPKPSTQTVTTNSVTVTPSGGMPPYSYQWSREVPRTIISSPNSATTYFIATLNDEEIDDTGTCVVTDARGQTATVQVPISITQQNGLN